MAVKLVTAPPGTGKTLLLIKMIFEFLKDGRRVYTNIDNLMIAECLPAPLDWRDLPDGSVVIYDEAQEHPAFSNDNLLVVEEFIEPDQLDNENLTTYRARVASLKREHDKQIKKQTESVKDIARSLQVHRHFGFDIVLATQHPSLLNSLTKNIVGEHYHLMRPFGLKACTMFFWRRKQDNPDSSEAKRSAEWKKIINFKKSYFALYRSANVHTHKAKIPMKYILFLILAIGLILSPFYMLSNNKAAKIFMGDKTVDITNDIKIDKPMPTDLTQAPLLTGETAPTEQPIAPTEQIISAPVPLTQKDIDATREINGCVEFGGKFKALDLYGREIPTKNHLCHQIIKDNATYLMAAPIPTYDRQQTTDTFGSPVAPKTPDQIRTDNLVQSQRDHFNEP